ncbi:MAG TPA: PxxKW family cysteine-rich protein [Syntrophales bacterium]|nr:PxxKW family cysteine-rich protein [Syntrophales bacterium]HOM07745.1 PxxKW family cysteine-rich protein [Syntrophales bacterium]HOO00408.1 PxxKW family cysteine-rich protein [Syntrophales bacterium]HPQ07268.1 PxxKW family cysteine-rich protein [Syntrophales bacterium]HRV43184.1 PxxKW family cysteine-rich protein [Syntrophales bacterium]
MICQTIKAGTYCGFMTKKGCSFTDGSFRTVVEQCEGCGRIVEVESGRYCKVYADPGSKWIIGKCPSATHVKFEIKDTTQKINPLKASKRASRAKKKK